MTTVYDSNNNEYTVTDGVLTISKGASGTGVMPNFTSSSTVRTLVGEDFTSVVIGSGMTNISNYAFTKCTSLASVTIPDSVTSIGSSVFQECTSLASVTIPDSVTSIGSQTFYQCTSLTSVTIPNSVTFIGGNMFIRCTSLASVTISSGIKSLGMNTFYGCTSLTSVTIPNSVTSIYANVFNGCTSLTSVTVLRTTPATLSGSDQFPNNPTTIYVPAGTGDTYKSAWSNYTSQIFDPESPTPSESKVDTVLQIITGFPTEL